MNKEAEINKKLIKLLKEKIQLLEEQKANSQEIINAQKEQLILSGVSKAFYCLEGGIKGSEHVCKKQCDSCNMFQQ